MPFCAICPSKFTAYELHDKPTRYSYIHSAKLAESEHIKPIQTPEDSLPVLSAAILQCMYSVIYKLWTICSVTEEVCSENRITHPEGLYFKILILYFFHVSTLEMHILKWNASKLTNQIRFRTHLYCLSFNLHTFISLSLEKKLSFLCNPKLLFLMTSLSNNNYEKAAYRV